ncbi:MAG: hypothetical protein ACK4GO_18025 [Gemmobacter sp.]
MRVAIAGAGPAGALAAILAQRAGLEVDLITLGAGLAEDSAQAAHVHILREGVGATLGTLDPDLSRHLHALTERDHRWMRPDGQVYRADRLSREGLMRALRAVLRDRGLHPRAAHTETLSPAAADLWIDASGGSRALLRHAEALGIGQLTLDDLGEPQVWETRLWGRALPGAPFTLVAPGRIYLQSGAGQTRMTGPLLAEPSPLADPRARMAPPDDLPSMLTHLTDPPDQSWRAVGPPPRLARWSADRDGPRLLPFGDALLQTPPRLGHGLMALAEQAVILQAHLADPGQCLAALTDWGEALWISAALHMSDAPA